MMGTVEDILVKLELAKEDGLLVNEIGPWLIVDEHHDIRAPHVVIQARGTRYMCTLSDCRADASLVIAQEAGSVPSKRIRAGGRWVCIRCGEGFTVDDLAHNICEVAGGLIHVSCREPGEEAQS